MQMVLCSALNPIEMPPPPPPSGLVVSLELGLKFGTISCYKYLLLTEFEGHTLSYGVFSPSTYGPSAKHAGHKSKGKKRGSVTYSTDRENEVSKIFIISLLCV